MMTPPVGNLPSFPRPKLWRTVSLPVGDSLNTVPLLKAPPALVVLTRLPAESRTRAALRFEPSEPLKLWSTVK